MCAEVFLWFIGGVMVSLYAYGIVWFLVTMVPRWVWLLLLAPLVYHLLTLPIG